MASAEFQLYITYHVIGEHHLLIHLFGCKVDDWMLLDLAEISNKTGQTYDEIMQRFVNRRAEHEDN